MVILAVRDAAMARAAADESEDIEMGSSEAGDENAANVELRVLDGIVMGPTVCVFEKPFDCKLIFDCHSIVPLKIALLNLLMLEEVFSALSMKHKGNICVTCEIVIT